MVFTSEEVIDAINNIDSVAKRYKEKYENFYNKFCGWERWTEHQKSGRISI